MMKLTFCIGLLCLSSWITTLQGAESPVEKSVDRAEPKPKPMCSNPRRNVGDSLISGCDKRTCIQIKNKADWHEEFAVESCCWQDQTAYKIGATFSSSKDPDTGIETTLRCDRTSFGSPHIVVDLSAKHCENQEIAVQVKEISGSLKQTNKDVKEIGESLKQTRNELQVANAKVEKNGNELEIVKKLLMRVVDILQPGTTATPSTTPTPTLAPMVEGVLIAGGNGAETSTELFLPQTGKTCSLQSLPDKREAHSMSFAGGKIILCGGQYTNTRTSCLEFLLSSSRGSWVHYATLAQPRYYHTSHIFQEDLLVMGGSASGGTTEIIGNGTQYNLQQDTSQACSIPDGSSFILTGGGSRSGILKAAVKYNMMGFVENLPDLVTARYAHGCGIYTDNGNKVLVVAGGVSTGSLSSTELLAANATSWTSGQSLPRALANLPSVNMDGYLLLIGGTDGGNRKEIPSLMVHGPQWEQ